MIPDPQHCLPGYPRLWETITRSVCGHDGGMLACSLSSTGGPCREGDPNALLLLQEGTAQGVSTHLPQPHTVPMPLPEPLWVHHNLWSCSQPMPPSRPRALLPARPPLPERLDYRVAIQIILMSSACCCEAPVTMATSFKGAVRGGCVRMCVSGS